MGKGIKLGIFRYSMGLTATGATCSPNVQACQSHSGRVSCMGKSPGILTSSVNAQLVTDAHRAEWAIEGDGFVVPKAQNDEDQNGLGQQKSPMGRSWLERFSMIHGVLALPRDCRGSCEVRWPHGSGYLRWMTLL